MTRSRMSNSGAATPRVAYPGSKPIAAVAVPIMSSVMRNVVFRPTVSPSRPNTNEPSGRTASPTAYVASVLRNARVGLSGG
jgi:hypothetical protein